MELEIVLAAMRQDVDELGLKLTMAEAVLRSMLALSNKRRRGEGSLAGCLAHRQYHRTLSDEGALLKNSAGLEKQYSRSRINECI